VASLGTLAVNIGANTRPLKQGLDNALGQAKSFANGVLQTFTGMQLSSLFSGAVQQVKGMALGVVNLAAEAEVARAAFSTLLMDVDKGAKLFSELEKFAARTSFSVQSAGEAATMLLAKGVGETDIIPTMQLLGDLAMGNSEKLGFLAKAYTDVQAKGKLMAQEQNQFAENGINLFELLARTTGKNTAELMAMREAGQISFGMVQKALISATAEGGKFYGALEKANATFTGQWNSLIEGVQTLGRMLGEMVLPHLTAMATKANQILQAFAAMPEKAKFLADVLVAAIDVGMAYLEEQWPKLMGRLITSTAAAAQQALDLTNPLRMIGNALGAGMNAQGRPGGSPALGEAQARLAGLLKQLEGAAGAGKKPDALKAVEDQIANAPPPDLGKALGTFIDKARGSAQPILQAVANGIEKKVFAGANMINAFSGLFGGEKKETPAIRESRAAAAVQKGSAEAFAAIRAAIAGREDVGVKATKEQTKALVKPLVQLVDLIENVQPLKMVPAFFGG
jgi:tape measure domain-containing protein